MNRHWWKREFWVFLTLFTFHRNISSFERVCHWVSTIGDSPESPKFETHFLQLLKNLQNPSSLFKKRASWDFHCVNQAFTLLHNYNTCKLQHSYFNPVHHSSDFLHLLFIKMETYFLPSTTYSAIMVKYFLLMLTQLEICVSVEPATPTIYKTCWLKTSKAGRRFEKNIISGSRICWVSNI